MAKNKRQSGDDSPKRRAPVVIENPVLNSPFEEPRRHWRFDEEGITSDIVEARRTSQYFMPIPKARKRGGAQMILPDMDWTEDRIEENKFINRVRQSVGLWRAQGYPQATKVSRHLLEHWKNPERERRLFFCQIEAVETAIYLAEAAKKHGDAWIENDLRDFSADANPGLLRVALKMATGSGKTAVMAMLIAWQVLNKRANPQDARFTDAFLLVAPGITIKDRLRVLYPSDPENCYRAMDIVPVSQMEQLRSARIVVTNFHAFKLREKVKASKTTKGLLGNGEAFTETPGQMVRRVCRGLGNKRNILVLNDEAHHCYRRRVGDEGEVKLKGDEKEEAKKREEYARVWISGLDAVREKKGIRLVYDLSATPFFLRGSGYSKITADGSKITEGLLFPWVVSDFSLVDSIECGIVKVPRVPVSDDSMTDDMPTYRNLWHRIRDELPKKGRKTEDYGGDPKLPQHLEGALRSLYGNYEKSYRQWEADADARAAGRTPPVFIVVCNNCNVSKMVFDWIAGYEKPVSKDESVIVPGNLTVFRNSEGDQWLHRPNTILVDSQQLESGESMSPEFKRVAAREIEEFKHQYSIRFQGRDAGKLTDEDLLREVMNTVGKPGKLGEQIKCVVSVSMLTEGWDANTVTHILGVRAFGTQLLCEQVVGRGLRRTSYVTNDDGMFEPQYAEVYGVPFSFIPCSGSTTVVKPPKPTTRVRALEEREDCMMRFPLLQGYKYEIADTKLDARFTDDSQYVLSTETIPTKVENAPIVGESSIHTLDDLKARRPREVAFLLAKLVLERYFLLDSDVAKEAKPEKHRFERNVQVWLFPQVLEIARRWLDECVRCKDNCFPQMLLFIEPAHEAADRIYRSIVASSTGEKRLKPLLQPYEYEGSTRHVDFNTTKPVYATRRDKCHVSHVVADTNSWEQKMAQSLEDMDEVVRYVKNQNIGFVIPYAMKGEEKRYYPDFLVHADDGHGDDLLNLIVEVTGQKKKDKEDKVATARSLWVPAVNNHGGFGRWAFVEIRDPWDAMREIRGFLEGGAKHG